MLPIPAAGDMSPNTCGTVMSQSQRSDPLDIFFRSPALLVREYDT